MVTATTDAAPADTYLGSCSGPEHPCSAAQCARLSGGSRVGAGLHSLLVHVIQGPFRLHVQTRARRLDYKIL